jgi:hypothetical protein
MANKENRAAKVKAREKANKAKKVAQDKIPKVFSSDDDEFIIQRLKKLGVWEEFQAQIDSKPGQNIELTLGNLFFVYICSDVEDSGFLFFECASEKDLQIVKRTWAKTKLLAG